MKCAICGNEFEDSARRPAKYCSDKCRVTAYRKKREDKLETERPTPDGKPFLGVEPGQKRNPSPETKNPYWAYMPTVNDPNISAMIAGRKDQLPYPEGGAGTL